MCARVEAEPEDRAPPQGASAAAPPEAPAEAPPEAPAEAPSQAPLELVSAQGTHRVAAVTAHEDRAGGSYERTPLCVTPCRLRRPPGPLELYVDGDGLRATLVDLAVPPQGLRVTFHAGREGAYTAGFWLVLAGLTASAVGPVLLALAPPTPAAGDATPFYAGGGALLGAGLVSTAVGLGLMLANPVGVAAVAAPTPAPAPTRP